VQGNAYDALVIPLNLEIKVLSRQYIQCKKACWFFDLSCKNHCTHEHISLNQEIQKMYPLLDIYSPPICYLNPGIATHATKLKREYQLIVQTLAHCEASKHETEGTCTKEFEQRRTKWIRDRGERALAFVEQPGVPEFDRVRAIVNPILTRGRLLYILE
jgi:hypothetical protein